MSISDFEQSLWELALLINPTHLANITTSKLNSYYQDTILDMRKVVLVQNLFNDIYNNWTDHQIRYQQNRRQMENGEIAEQPLIGEESEENESEIEYISDEDPDTLIDDERYELEFAQPEIEMAVEENKENIDNNSNIIIGNDNTVIQLPVRKDSVSHKSNGKPIKKAIESQPIIENNTIEPMVVEPVNTNKSSKDMAVEKSKVETKTNSKNNAPSKEMKKKHSKSENKEPKPTENKEPVKKITLDFSSKDAAKAEETKKSNESSASEEKETQKKSKKEHSRRKKIEREPRKDSLKANVNLSNEKSNEVIKELQKSGVLNKTPNEDKNQQKNITKSDIDVSSNEKTEPSISISSSSSNSTSGNSFVIRSFNIPSQQKTEIEGTSISPTTKILTKQEPVPVRKSSASVPPPLYKKNKVTYRLSDKDISIKDKYKIDKIDKVKEEKKVKPTAPEQPNVHLRPDAGMPPPAIQRRSLDELHLQFADVMDIVSLIPHIIGDDDLLGNDLTFNSSNLNSKVQTKDSNGNVTEEAPRRRPSRAPTPPPTVVSNGKEYEVYSIPSERHQKYIKKKEEMEKSNKRRSSLKFEYHEFEELRKQQELAGYDTTGDVPVTERKKENVSSSRSSNKSSSSITKSSNTSKSSSSKSSSSYKRGNTSSSSSSNTSNHNSTSTNSCGSTMKMDVLSTCMSSSNSNSSHGSSKNSSSKRSSRFFNLSKSKSKAKEKERMNKENKENISSNGKNYLPRRKSNEKSSSRSHRFLLGGSQDSSSPSQSSPTLSSISSSSNGSKSSGMKKSYSSTTLSKYDFPQISTVSSESSSRHHGSSSSESSEREKHSTKQTIPTSKSSPGLFEGIDFSAPLNTPKRQPKKATEQRSSSTSEIDKFFDNVFRIDWTL